MSNPTRHRRAMKPLVASIMGITLLLGGSTYALWSSSDITQSEATITAGDLQVTPVSAKSWFDVTDSANPVLVNLNTYKASPGDVLRLNQELNVIVYGDNISGTLEVLTPNETLSSSIMNQAKFTLKLFDKDNVELGAITPAQNTTNSLSLEVAELPRTTREGQLYTIELSVELPTSADNLTKEQLTSLNNMSITLRQGAALKKAAEWQEVSSLLDGKAQRYSSLAITPDGKNVVAGAGNTVYVSHDHGDTWASTTSTGNEKAVDISSDGQALVSGGSIPNVSNPQVYGYKYSYTSTDGGKTWDRLIDNNIFASTIMTPKCRAVDVSDKGKILVAGCANDLLIQESDRPAQKFTLPGYIVSVAATEGLTPNARIGRWVDIVLSNGKVYRTLADKASGSWRTPFELISAPEISLVTISPNYVTYRVSQGGDIYKDTKLVSSNPQKWTFIKAVTDTKLFAIADSKLYTSSDAAATWSEVTTPGENGVTYAAIAEDGTTYITSNDHLLKLKIDW